MCGWVLLSLPRFMNASVIERIEHFQSFYFVISRENLTCFSLFGACWAFGRSMTNARAWNMNVNRRYQPESRLNFKKNVVSLNYLAPRIVFIALCGVKIMCNLNAVQRSCPPESPPGAQIPIISR